MDFEINIKKPNQIITEQIQVKKRISISTNVYEYPLSYLRKQIIIQTPIVYIPHTTYKVNSKITFDFFFLNLKVDCEMEQLKKFVQEMDKIVKSKISAESKPYKNPQTKKNVKRFTIKPKEFISNIKSYKSSSSQKKEMMRVNCYENIHAFDEYKRPISLDYLKAKVYLKLLLSPVKIWVHKEKYGIFWEVLQIKIYPKAVLNTYMFIDDNSQQQQKKQALISSHPEYSKYFDMMKKGVPKQAVKNKMLLDGKDPNILDNPNTNVNSISGSNSNRQISEIKYSPNLHPPILNVPPPPPPPPMLMGSNPVASASGDRSHMFSELMNTVKLKGTKRPDIYKDLENQSKERAKNNTNKNSGKGSFGNYTPSLDEIVKRRNTLRKTSDLN